MSRLWTWFCNERPGGDPDWLALVKIEAFILATFLGGATVFGLFRWTAS